MLGFFRKHQKYFYVLITVLVVLSFSFFGTYGTLTPEADDPVVFQAIDGTKVHRSQLQEMSAFLATDSEDKILWGGIWGPNFLNDGYVCKDILEAGLGGILIGSFADQLADDLNSRLKKEKRFQLYSNPQAKFVGAQTVYAYFAPDILKNLEALQMNSQATDPSAVQTRIGLFLAERRFPAPKVRQILQYQERQYGWLPQDPELAHGDLSLFGYHTILDWFGPHFMDLVAEFVINSSKIAEKKGYRVSEEEALASLYRNAEISFRQNIDSPYLGVANSNEYFREQLRRLGIDQGTAVAIWQKVLECRRLFQDISNGVLIDPLLDERFIAYARSYVDGDMYQLPISLRLGNFLSLQKLQVYLGVIAKGDPATVQQSISVPTKFHTVEEVLKSQPELVQKRYLLEIAEVIKAHLQEKVTLRDTWNWEVADENWVTLKKKFPELGVVVGSNREGRLEALDKLDDKTRAVVDNTARSAIVDAHPEWLEQALQDAETVRKIVAIPYKGVVVDIAGLKDGSKLIQLLDEAPIASNDVGELNHYTVDQKTYYRIQVIERNDSPEIMTFKNADQSGVLEKLLLKKLDALNSKSEKKQPLAEVRDQVAEKYFEKLLKAISDDYKKASKDTKAVLTPDVLASLRFYSYAREIRTKLEKSPEKASGFILDSNSGSETNDSLTLKNDNIPLEDQWKFLKQEKHIYRDAQQGFAEAENVFSLEDGTWTGVYTPVHGDISFFHIRAKGYDLDKEYVTDRVMASQKILSRDAQQKLMRLLVDEFKEKNAMLAGS